MELKGACGNHPSAGLQESTAVSQSSPQRSELKPQPLHTGQGLADPAASGGITGVSLWYSARDWGWLEGWTQQSPPSLHLVFPTGWWSLDDGAVFQQVRAEVQSPGTDPV